MDTTQLLKSFVTVEQAAELMGKSAARVKQLVNEEPPALAGAIKWGRDWIIPRASALAYARNPRKIGRPKSISA